MAETRKTNQPGTICTYRIDAQGVIVSVGDKWEAFAAENHAPHACFAPQVIGSPIWDHIRDRETRHIYEILITKVRQTRQPITLPLRCDAPDLKRFLEITLIPEQKDHIAFESRIIGVESRPPVPLLDACHPRSTELIRICSFCKQIDLGEDHWVDTETAVTKMKLFNQAQLPQLTHTVCPPCYKIAMAKSD